MALPMVQHTFISTVRVCLLQEDAQEEFGWKLVHGDVFRPPRKGMLLSVFLGCGVQIFFMSMITLGTSTNSHRSSHRSSQRLTAL